MCACVYDDWSLAAFHQCPPFISALPPVPTSQSSCPVSTVTQAIRMPSGPLSKMEVR
jgi:hypothetical protein